MKKSELNNKRVWPYSFDESFHQIGSVIKRARDKLEILSPPPEVFTMREYYPYNYSNPWDQACYVMRYFYAYSYEYFMLFCNIFEGAFRENNIKIVSLGCGAMPDAWAIQEAAKRMKISGNIEYIGVDLKRWPTEYIPETTDRISKSFIYGKAGDYLQSCTDECFDILFFPKSLGDMYKNDRSDLFVIKHALGDTIPLKDNFYLAFSFIDNEQDNRKDLIEMEYLLQSIRNRGFMGEPIKNKKTKVGICNSYPPYPMLDNSFVEDSRSLAKKHFMTSREHENYYICKFTKVN